MCCHSVGRLWYGKPDGISNAIGYAKFRSRSHDAAIRVYDAAGNVIETHEHKGSAEQPRRAAVRKARQTQSRHSSSLESCRRRMLQS
jgi:hypothetical protein